MHEALPKQTEMLVFLTETNWRRLSFQARHNTICPTQHISCRLFLFVLVPLTCAPSLQMLSWKAKYSTVDCTMIITRWEDALCMSFHAFSATELLNLSGKIRMCAIADRSARQWGLVETFNQPDQRVLRQRWIPTFKSVSSGECARTSSYGASVCCGMRLALVPLVSASIRAYTRFEILYDFKVFRYLRVVFCKISSKGILYVLCDLLGVIIGQ